MRACLVGLLLACPAVWAQFAVDVSPLGGLSRISLNGRPVGQDLQLRVVKPGWNGEVGSQGPEGGLRVTETAEGNARLYQGEFAAEGKPIAFQERLEVGPQAAALRWKLTPSADVPTELVVVTVAFPTAGNAGAGDFLSSDGDVITTTRLPATLPDPYHIAGADQSAWCGWLLPGDVGLRLEPDGTGITGFSFQDDRQFKVETLQAQLAVRGTQGLKAGKTYEFGLTLKPLTKADLDRERRQQVDATKALEVPMTSSKPLALRGLKLSATQVPAFEKLEIALDLDATYDNPFDPRDVDVTATFTGPGGRQMTVPGFFSQDYEWYGRMGPKRLKVAGAPGWRVRFAPPAAGTWEVKVSARDRSGQRAAGPASFECVPGTAPGYVRRVPGNPYYMQFDNGAPYFAVGENVCWAWNNQTELYDTWLSALGDAGGNYCRIWLVRWNMALEWSPGKGSGAYHGLGKYSLDNAHRLDAVMARARRSGIYCMLCLGYHGELMDTKGYFGEDCWSESPYNRANGGPCDKPAQFWTNPEARRAYQQRLRYYIARYGWDTHLLSFEFWNEVSAPAPWIAEMARYVKSIDPYQHLLTTTYGDPDVWRVPDLDYTQAHTYGSDEDRPRTVPALAPLGREYTTRWPKPFMVGEFGIDWKSGDDRHDPQGLGTSLHDGLWCSVMTRCFGAASIWYWDGYVHPRNLYHEFTGVRKFVDTVPWPKLKLDFADFGATAVPVPADAPWGDIHLAGTLGWARQPEGELRVQPDGSIAGGQQFSELLFSAGKPDVQSPLKLRVTYPRAGKLILRVGSVSARGLLRVKVDGQEAWSHELLTGAGQGEWKSTQFYPQWGVWQSVYDKDYEVPIPAGEHAIVLENAGSDWVTVPALTFVGCRDPRLAQLDLLGLRAEDFAVLWAHDPESNWYNDKLGKLPKLIAGASTTLLGLTDGTYRVEWWDTRKGTVMSTAEARCEGGKLPLLMPDFTRDVAAQVRRQ